MKYRTRTFYTDRQKSEMWDRWQRGESMSSIGRHFNRASSSIFPHLAQFGGIRPPARKRSRFALSLVDREEISRGLVAQKSLRSIAKGLNRSPSTISREVRRNGGRQAYRAARSDERAWNCAMRPKSCKLSFNDPLCQLIARKLRRKWSWSCSRCEVQKRCNVWLAHEGFSYFIEVKPTASDSTDCTLG